MPAPSTEQDGTRPPQDLVNIVGTAIVINLPLTEPSRVDVRIRDRFVQYTNDPTSGVWRTSRDGRPERVTPYTLRRITVGQRGGIEVEAALPRTGETRHYEGDPDEIASALHRAAARIGVRGDRQGVFWALREFTALARRQAAARGGSL